MEKILSFKQLQNLLNVDFCHYKTCEKLRVLSPLFFKTFMLVARMEYQNKFFMSSSFMNSCPRYMIDCVIFSLYFIYFNPLQPGVAFLYPLKTSENLKVF